MKMHSMTSAVQHIILRNIRTAVGYGFDAVSWDHIPNVEFAVGTRNASVILPVWTNLDLGFDKP